MVGLKDLFNLVATVDRLMNLEAKHGKAIEVLTERFLELDIRVTSLEAREEIVVAKAQAAAGVAASQVAMSSVADMSRRVGALEERGRLLPQSQASLPPPSD